jgi:hypothetical protein
MNVWLNKFGSALFAAAGLCLLGTVQTAAQTGGGQSLDCSGIQKSILTDAIPRDQLRDWQGALQCLLRTVNDLKPSITTVQSVNGRADLLKAARAIRLILDENTAGAIRLFRNNDNLDIISVLTFGARSNDNDIRINSTLILGNVVDNTTLCVPIDHLYDEAISVNGRINLLAVVNVVTGYAYQQNLANIVTLTNTLTNIPDNLADTKRVVDTLKGKVAVRQKEIDGGTSPTPVNPELPIMMARCNKYRPLWAGGRLRYSQ